MVLRRRANIGLVNIRSNEYLWKICGQQYLWKICAHQAYLINITLTNCWILIESSVKPTDKDVLVTGQLFSVVEVQIIFFKDFQGLSTCKLLCLIQMLGLQNNVAYLFTSRASLLKCIMTFIHSFTYSLF